MQAKKLRVNLQKLFSEHPITKDLSAAICEFEVELLDDSQNVIAVGQLSFNGKIGIPLEASNYVREVELKEVAHSN